MQKPLDEYLQCSYIWASLNQSHSCESLLKESSYEYNYALMLSRSIEQASTHYTE